MIDDELEPMPEVRQLSARQRRVLGVLLEKAATTPEYYPLTLKALTAGCNQKNNRSPVVDYDEDQTLETLDELRKLGLAAVVHTESGRTERYRHYFRKRYSFSQIQAAALTELLLRGRQSLGDLRTRISRFVTVEDLETLRQELSGLLVGGYLQASGPLERRGVEVDHTFYLPAEQQKLSWSSPAEPADSSDSPRAASVSPSPAAADTSRLSDEIAQLQQQQAELRAELASVRETVSILADRIDQLCRDLGV